MSWSCTCIAHSNSARLHPRGYVAFVIEGV
jgi:hypothetical protein